MLGIKVEVIYKYLERQTDALERIAEALEKLAPDDVPEVKKYWLERNGKKGTGRK